jgi:hypothetical protein
MSKNSAITAQDRSLLMLLIATVITIIIWFLPFGRLILYPFTILGTWFHEMGHGLTSLMLGGHFDRLEIFSNGSGLAYTAIRGAFVSKELESALVAAGGLIAPPIFGTMFMVAGRNSKMASITLAVFSVALLASLAIWVRSVYGLGVIGAIAFMLSLLAFTGWATVKQFCIQFLGVQAILNTYQQINYLFTEKVEIDGKAMLSDTGNIAANLMLPYWFWGGAILFFSVLMLLISYKIAYSEKNNSI